MHASFIKPEAEASLHMSCIPACNLSMSPGPWMCIAGYEEGQMLKNVTSRLLSQAVQDSMPDVGLVPTYQNYSVCNAQMMIHMHFFIRCLGADLHADLLGTHLDSSCKASDS